MFHVFWDEMTGQRAFGISTSLESQGLANILVLKQEMQLISKPLQDFITVVQCVDSNDDKDTGTK